MASSEIAASAFAIRNFSGRFLRAGNETFLEVRAETDAPDGAVATVRVDGLWPGLEAPVVYEGMHPVRLAASAGRLDGRCPAPAGLIPGRYRLTIEIDPRAQDVPAVARVMARRRAPPPVVDEAFAGGTTDLLKRMAEERAASDKAAETVRRLMDDLDAFARTRTRSESTESRMKSAADALDLELGERVLSPVPPFPATFSVLHDLLEELEAVIPAATRTQYGAPTETDERGKPLDPQALFADRRIETRIAGLRPRLVRVADLIRKEHAGALLAEMGRVARRLAQAYAAAGNDPSGWGEARREGQDALSRLDQAVVAAADAPGKRCEAPLVLLQSVVVRICETAPEAGSGVPADIALGLDDLDRALDTARRELAP